MKSHLPSMTNLRTAVRSTYIAAVPIALTVVLTSVLVAGIGMHAPPSVPSSSASVASGSVRQWAFGGVGSASFSCSEHSCGSLSSNLSLDFRYYVEWVVIYTVTNVSATQTEVEAEAALNASVTLALTECKVVTTGSPCENSTISLSLSGRESAVGFTNLTTGSVNLSTSVGPVGSTPAWAISNAASNESFNFSGALSATLANASGPVSESASFDLGGSEGASVAFPTPLGVVPQNPQPGDTWNSSAPFSAQGAFTSGYSISGSAGGRSVSESKWGHGTVSPSGTLFVNGTDLGAYTLWDNYTQPPTSVTAQAILLEFGSGNWTGSDGWLMVPTGIYSGALTGVPSSPSLVRVMPDAGASFVPATVSAPRSESTYFEPGVGFIGARASENASTSGSGLSSPSVNVQAGPEPVSVAQSQYTAIISGPGSSGSSIGIWLVLVLVAVAAVAVAVILAWRRTRRPVGVSPSSPTISQAGSPAAAPPMTDSYGSPLGPRQPGSGNGS